MTFLFSKLLVANRGEIACRIMRTASRMGIGTVAVYSEADTHAMHVRASDESVLIGPAPAAQSYLNVAAILDAARQVGADAIHPGYGFLSENPDFVDAVAAARLTFVGPSAASIRAMGLKDAAKRRMEEAKVPVVPGYHGEDQSPDHLAASADTIGYPVMIKARAGGGGKGMRRVDDPSRFLEGLASARREASAAFGDDRVLIEKFILSPRHIEVQVFGDNHGNVVHLFERDCSLQRRHQKVIEEAPAPGMSEAVRAAMTEAAVRAAKAINYSGAGTIEFIADGSGPLREDGFWFMEMNTRLQVEHPVTEAITGTDLVEWQLRVAAGQPLPLAQHEIRASGHAVEARLYAEDPAGGFLPQAGSLDRLEFGSGAGVRVDGGVCSGDVVSPFYDPMIAKVIAHASTRQEALARLGGALDNTLVSGLVTNRDFLRALCRHEEFVAGRMDTALIDRNLDNLVYRAAPSEETVLLAALLAYGIDPQENLAGFRLWGEATRSVHLTCAGYMLERRLIFPEGAEVSLENEDGIVRLCEVKIDRETGLISAVAMRANSRRTNINAHFHLVQYHGAIRVTLLQAGGSWEFERDDPLAPSEAEGNLAGEVCAPMTGVVQIVRVSPGDNVQAGTPLVVMEAMKMEHTLTAPRNGIVESVFCAPGSYVEGGALLIRLANIAEEK